MNAKRSFETRSPKEQPLVVNGMSTTDQTPEKKPNPPRKTVVIQCHKCGHEIRLTRAKAAALMGAFCRGTKKNFSDEERERRAALLALAREKRWAGKKKVKKVK